MRVTIRDVTEACPIAGTAGTPALRDTALEVAPRVAPPGSSRDRVVEIAAALILLGVRLDPTDHGLSLDAETVARAAAEHEQLLRAGEPVEARLTRLQHERDIAVEKSLALVSAAADNTRARLDAEDRATLAEQERDAARAELAAANDRRRTEIGIDDRLRAELQSKLDDVTSQRDSALARIATLVSPADDAPAVDLPGAPGESRKRRS